MARRRIPAAVRYAVALAALLLVGGAVWGGVWAKDQLDRRAVQAKAEARWRAVRPRVAARIGGQQPLELGAVWMTHKGRICGLVNGGSSFGGLTGMTPFLEEGGRVLFRITTMDENVWAPAWRECVGDAWLTLHQGSMQTGYCATKAGQTRCKTYG